VRAATGQLDEEQHVQPFEPDRLDREVDCEQAVSVYPYYQDVFPLLQSFESLAARYAPVMDPELSMITIRIRDIDLIDVLSRARQQTFDHDLNDRLAGLITSLLLEITAHPLREDPSHWHGTGVATASGLTPNTT
jgi:hypothetical protein